MIFTEYSTQTLNKYLVEFVET